MAGAGNGEARHFLDGCLSQATWLERSLDGRRGVRSDLRMDGVEERAS